MASLQSRVCIHKEDVEFCVSPAFRLGYQQVSKKYAQFSMHLTQSEVKVQVHEQVNSCPEEACLWTPIPCSRVELSVEFMLALARASRCDITDRYETTFTNARLIMLYAFRARTMDFARRRVEGISDTMVYTTGPTEKSATAERSKTIEPAVHDVAVVGFDGIPMPPATLYDLC